MPYGKVILPATGGGLVLAGVVASFFRTWILVGLVIVLGLGLLGLWRLQRGERDLNRRSD